MKVFCLKLVTILAINTFLVTAEVGSCTPDLIWQKSGESGTLKWAQSGDEGYLNVKLTLKQSSLPVETVQEMIDTKEHVPFTVGVLFQRCLPNIEILSEFTQTSVVTKNCGEKKKELTLVTLMSTPYLKTSGTKYSLLLKKVSGFNAMITGLPELVDFDQKCIPFKHKNCIFPFYVGAVAGHHDLSCLADSLTNQP